MLDFLKNIGNSKKTVKSTQGYCPCCENHVKFSSKHAWLRDHYLCSNCKCIPRERHLTYMIESVLPNWRELSIHESSPCKRGASVKLKENCEHYIASHYYPDSDDEYIDGYKNIDLQNQNFKDETFDLIVTQDVFEHIPAPDVAIKEIARTLKTGGYFISTIPLVNKFNATVKWAELKNGTVNFIYEPDYHGNPIDPKGSPVFWHYGYDIASYFIKWSGMETIIVNNIIPDLGIEAVAA
jgi:SAM-dependent methyltransferase